MTVLEFDRELNNRGWTRELCKKLRNAYLGTETNVVYRFVFLCLPLNDKIEEVSKYKPWSELAKMENCPELCEVFWKWLLENLGDALVCETTSSVVVSNYISIYAVVEHGAMRLFGSRIEAVCYLRMVSDCHAAWLEEMKSNSHHTDVVARIRCRGYFEEICDGYTVIKYRVSDEEEKNKLLLEIRKDGVTLLDLQTSEIVYYLRSDKFRVKKE